MSNIFESALDDVSEEELIALAIAASLCESSSEHASEAPPAELCAHSEEIYLQPPGSGGSPPQHGSAASLASLSNSTVLTPFGSSPPVPSPGAGAWGKGAPRTSISAPDGAESHPPAHAPDHGTGGPGDVRAESLTPSKSDGVLEYAEFIGSGYDDCANEDEAILGVPLTEIAAQRVVRFRVPLIASSPSPAGTHTVQGTSGEAGAGREGRRWVVHGYDAMSLTRWLLRDQRLPLTSHRVSEEDVARVWEVFRSSAQPDELTELESCGELVSFGMYAHTLTRTPDFHVAALKTPLHCPYRQNPTSKPNFFS